LVFIGKALKPGLGAEIMADPFKLMGRLLLTLFRSTGYTAVYLSQAAWFLVHRRRDKIGDTIGSWGKATTDAVSEIFK
jgi:hypothetical protein